MSSPATPPRIAVGARDGQGAIPIPIAGQWRTLGGARAIKSPYDGAVVAHVTWAGSGDIDEAIQAADRSFAATRRLPSHERARILSAVSSRMAVEREQLARTMVLECGKPLRDSLAEVDRAAMTFQIAAEEARRIESEVVPMDWRPDGEGRFAMTRRFPVGVVAAITPFNNPLNLVAHKLAPAVAAGNPIVLKPASQTPLSALHLAAFLHEAGWPAAALSVTPASGGDFEPALMDRRIAKVSFTGSTNVGWRIKQLAWRKKVTLELGGNAGVVVHNDCDVDLAASRVVTGGFQYSGQSCVSVQRVFVHRDLEPSFTDLVASKASQLVIGDPMDEATDIGPMIDIDAIDRTDRWIDEAIAAGAKAVLRGERVGNALGPTVLTGVTASMNVCAKEVFAPLITISPYDDFDDALIALNDSEFGLQAGVFTRDVRRIWRAYEDVDVGGLMVNEVPAWRVDHMPYGGVKESGWGREGIRCAIEGMTEPRLMVLAVR